MKREKALILGLLKTLFVSAISFSLLAEAPDYVAFGDLRGHIESCGCDPKTDLGGIGRLSGFLQREKSTLPNLVVFDLGNNIDAKNQNATKQKFILSGIASLNPTARLLNVRELMHLTDISFSSNFVISNSFDLKFSDHKPIITMIETNHLKIFGYVYDTSLEKNLKKFSQTLATEWRAKLKGRAFKVLLFSGPSEDLSAIAKVGLFDLIISSNVSTDDGPNLIEQENPDFLRRREAGEDSYMVPLAGIGVLLGGRLREKTTRPLAELFGSSGKSFTDNAPLGPKGIVTWLTGDYLASESMMKVMADYRKESAQAFSGNQERRLKLLINSPYAGAAACEKCHPQAYEVWKKSDHEHAYVTLQQKGQHENAECVGCHVVGLDNGGFVSIKDSSQFAGVQCENCHGARSEHAKNPSKSSPNSQHSASQVCSQCHHSPHTASFKFDEYWQKIKH